MEIVYLVLDIVPIILSFFIGIIILPMFVVLTNCYPVTCCTNLGNNLITWLYGGQTTEVNELRTRLLPGSSEAEASSQPKCLHSCLMVNAMTLATIVTMIFLDTFVIKSDYGCSADLDCYIEDNKYIESPINCSHPLNPNEKTICYKFTLDYFQAFAETGGILFVAAHGVFVMKIMWSCCGTTSKRTHCCALYTSKIVFLAVIFTIVTVVLAIFHVHTHERYTSLRVIDHVLKHLAVAISFIMTTLTPWHVVKKSEENR